MYHVQQGKIIMAIITVRNPAIDLDAAEIPNLDASKITLVL